MTTSIGPATLSHGCVAERTPHTEKRPAVSHLTPPASLHPHKRLEHLQWLLAPNGTCTFCGKHSDAGHRDFQTPLYKNGRALAAGQGVGAHEDRGADLQIRVRQGLRSAVHPADEP